MVSPIFAAISAVANPQLDLVMEAITNSYLAIIPLLFVYLAYSRDKRLYPLVIALAISIASVTVMKPVFNETRPCAELTGIHAIGCEASKSFPSTHTAIAFTLLPFFNTIPAYAYALLIGVSRVYLGQHYPTDVLVGALLGLGVGYACLRKKDWLLNQAEQIKNRLGLIFHH